VEEGEELKGKGRVRGEIEEGCPFNWRLAMEERREGRRAKRRDRAWVGASTRPATSYFHYKQ